MPKNGEDKMRKCPKFVDGPTYCYAMKTPMFRITRKEKERRMIQQMEYIDGFQFISREDFAKMTREELQAHLESRGFAVFDNEPLDQLIEAAQSDFDDEYFG